MKLSHIIAALEEYAPLTLQEKWDNSGLQIGLPPEADGECTGALLCLDVTP
ncbi:MAG: Nif3-like dinuclear metal center hexameric protein, partial [Muribaculaceae bacterium]|nr:Nif3-like dinuclear metal center hexameric protein [Muribaculaceae bacterium]